MTALANFLDWLYKLLVRALVSIRSTWVQVSAALVSCTVTIGTMFSRFTWLQSAADWVGTAATNVESFVQSLDVGPFAAFWGWLSLGTASQVGMVVVGCTVGATCAILIGAFVAVFALVPVVLGIRAVLKAIRTGTAGFIDP